MKNLLNNSIILLAFILIVVTGVLVSIIIFIPKLIKKGVKIDKYIDTANNVLTKIDPILSVANEVLPNNPALKIIDLIDSRAKEAVAAAEQMYISTQLTADQRKAKAKELVTIALTTVGIKVTPDIEKIIDGAIEAEVFALGHADSTQKTLINNLTKQNTQLKIQVATANSNTIKVQQEAAELKQKLTTTQNTAVIK